MTWFDWGIVVATILGSLVVGLMFARRASRSGEDYFVAGRSLGWFMAGTSMVATTFSSDTPLFVSGMVRNEGVYANWIWWAMVPAALGTTFFFARLWRRSSAITEVEFIVQRYDDSLGVRLLRVMRALFDGAFTNSLIMASVTLAMSKILVAILGLSSAAPIDLPMIGTITPSNLLLIGLGAVALVYTGISGLYGVVYTDFIQFCVAMFGAVMLSAIAYVDLGGGSAFASAVKAADGFRPGATFAIVPDLRALDLPAVTFLILVSIGWIGSTPGSGHFIQRILATRTERDAMLSMYWYAFSNYVLRSWPWIITGLASLVYFPHIADAEQAYPEMVNSLLPVGLKGIMVASLISAFMSTITTQLNWGTSYMINDIYRPYLVTDAKPHHYVSAARVGMLLMVLLALGVSAQLDTILQAYKYLIVMTAGSAFVLVARWYWWRVTVWSEITSIVCSLGVGISLFWLLPDSPGHDYFAARLAINMLVSTAVVIAVTLISSRKGPSPQAHAFYRRLRVGGVGWQRVRRATGCPADTGNLATSAIAWLASTAFIYGALFGLGYALLAEWPHAAVALAVAGVSLVVINKTMPAILRDLASIKRTDAGQIAAA